MRCNELPQDPKSSHTSSRPLVGRLRCRMVPDPDPSELDAVAVAKELDDLLAESSTSATAEGRSDYIKILEIEIEEVNAQLAKNEVLLAQANERADEAHAEIAAASKRLASAATKEL